MTFLKRGLALATVIVIVGVVGCTTTPPFITSFTGLPATMNVGDIATLTATGAQAAAPGCGIGYLV